MPKNVFLFPGQGSQQVGMCADVAASIPQARRVFDRANEILGFDLARLCFDGPPEALNATNVAQIALFVASTAMIEAMDANGLLDETKPEWGAGLSLGEYTALYAAGSLDFEGALRLVCRRGDAMQRAAEAHPGGMVSIMGMDETQVSELCVRCAEDGVLVPANFNTPEQIVISGDLAGCQRALDALDQTPGVRGVQLRVAGAFHSPLMSPAAEELGEALDRAKIVPPLYPVIANVDAEFHVDPDATRRKLQDQLTSPVRWSQSIKRLIAEGAESFHEIGPGRVLTGMMRKIDRKARANNFSTIASLRQEAA
jgi:[acyl-carrier-protein] S-malonyltransferase